VGPSGTQTDGLTRRHQKPEDGRVKIPSLRMSAAILVAACAWMLHIRHAEKQQLAAEITELRERIAQPRIPVIQPLAEPMHSAIDWESLARTWPAFGDDYGIYKARIRLNQKLLHASADELSAALDDLLAADIPQRMFESYAWRIVEPLGQLDPELALAKCIHAVRHSDGAVLFPLGAAFEAWAWRDPQAAITWFDHEVEMGTFMDRSFHRTQPPEARFEHILLRVLIDTHPDVARQRIARIPEDLRRDYLREAARYGPCPIGYTAVLRDAIPAGYQRDVMFSWPVRHLVEQRGFDAVTEFMDAINASSSERKEMLQVALQVKPVRSMDDFLTMWKWSRLHDPERADELAGARLCAAVAKRPGLPGFSFEQASQIAVDSESESLLAGFLHGHAARDRREQSRELITHISDPDLRKRVSDILK